MNDHSQFIKFSFYDRDLSADGYEWLLIFLWCNQMVMQIRLPGVVCAGGKLVFTGIKRRGKESEIPRLSEGGYFRIAE